jgi:hypothetical protein
VNRGVPCDYEKMLHMNIFERWETHGPIDLYFEGLACMDVSIGRGIPDTGTLGERNGAESGEEDSFFTISGTYRVNSAENPKQLPLYAPQEWGCT